MGNEQYILNTVNKGLKMGMDSISTISEKVGDENFKDDLIYQYNQYNDILNRVNNELQNNAVNNVISEIPQTGTGMFEYALCFVVTALAIVFGYIIIRNGKEK